MLGVGQRLPEERHRLAHIARLLAAPQVPIELRLVEVLAALVALALVETSILLAVVAGQGQEPSGEGLVVMTMSVQVVPEVDLLPAPMVLLHLLGLTISGFLMPVSAEPDIWVVLVERLEQEAATVTLLQVMGVVAVARPTQTRMFRELVALVLVALSLWSIEHEIRADFSQ